MGMMDGVINVKEFGAKGDGDFTNDGEAIQAAIDEVNKVDSSGNLLHRDGVTIYFPEGRYAVNGGSLLLPRLASTRTIVFKGAGWMVSTILNNGDPTASPLFKADPDPTNHHGANGYVFEDLELAVGLNQQTFRWDVQIPEFGDNLSDPLDAGRRFMGIFQRVFFRGTPGSSEPIMMIRGGFRTRFLQCYFYGADGPGGVSAKLLSCGGVTLIDCQSVFVAGALLDVEGGGELVAINCRSESGVKQPAWKFVNVRNVTLINPANEGKLESPSVFYFEKCDNVLMMNPQIATAEKPIEGDEKTGKFADGVQFIGCSNCRVMNGYGPGYFGGYGDRTARMIRVDAASRNITGDITTAANPVESDVDIQGKMCCFEISGTGDDKRVITVGDCHDHTIWISPLNFVISEGAPGWETLSISRGFSGNTIRVKSTAPGDLKWIALPLSLPTNLKIKKLSVGYRASHPSHSFISQIRLSEEIKPPTATVLHDDPTDLKEAGPISYESNVGSLQPKGAITLSLRLKFADATHHIDIGSIGVFVGS